VSRVTVLSIVVSSALLLYILEMVRRRKLREEYSILWLAGSVVILVLSLKQDWLIGIALAAGSPTRRRSSSWSGSSSSC